MCKSEVIKLFTSVYYVKEELLAGSGRYLPEEVFGPVSCLVQYFDDECEGCDGEECEYFGSLFKEYGVDNHWDCVVACCNKIKEWLDLEGKLQTGNLSTELKILQSLVEVIITLV